MPANISRIRYSEDQEDDNLVVASLRMVMEMSYGDNGAAMSKTAAELLLLRHGKWSIQLPIMVIHSQHMELLSSS